jgi:hypothetical protein
MIGGDDHGGRDEYAPVPVDRQEGEGSQDMEMGLDPSACEVNQQ